MKIRNELEDDFYGKGFTGETDPFGRADLAQRLSRLYGNLAQGTVSILDGRWGVGKTVFVRQWKNNLENQGTPCIYFDAFAADYVDSPFRAIASAFVRAAQKARAHDSKTYNSFLEAASKAGRLVAAPVGKVAVKALTLGLLGASEAEEFKKVLDEVASGLGEISDATVKAMLEQQAGDEASFEALRASLAKLPVLLAKDLEVERAPKAEESEDTAPSLVVIVDELDRCRPDFALGILEVLKHFFRAERVHFVLVTNLNHLMLSVQKRYGVGEAAGEYLQKFYDFVIPFGEGEQQGRTTNASKHAVRLLHAMLPEAQSNKRTEFIESVSSIIFAFDLTLRQAERLVTNVVLAQIDFSRDRYLPGTLIALLATIKLQNPLLYSNIKRAKLNSSQILEFFDKGNWSEGRSANLRNLILYHSAPMVDEQSPDFSNFRRVMSHYNFDDRLDILPYLANSVLDRF